MTHPDPLDVTHYDGGRIELHYDESAESPRDWWNVSRMVTWHPSYVLGEHQEDVHRVRGLIAPPECWNCGEPIHRTHGAWWHPNGLAYCRDAWGDLELAAPDDDTYPTVAAWLATEYDVIPETIVPLYLLDHSGLAMSTGPFGCDPGGWDSGVVGYAFATPESLTETGCSVDDAPNAIRGEVSTFDDYLGGSVYYYMAYNSTGELVESCGGYYDSDEAIAEAQDEIAHAHRIAQERRDAALATDGLYAVTR